ncbi:MAG: AAA family ATPase [Dehalococcoidia bacterium]|nr:AAA family ATPase [Dehalococcoidia bacterium]MDD5494521.1 AAA family ATPase [Dehalococcoidia bacterium]
MSVTIAVAGKGGVGKTAISAILVDFLSGKGTVLAVDADPSTNLNEALGINLVSTIGRTREKMTDDIKGGRLTVAASKQEILDARIHESLVETPRFDLLAMGRPEGPGCYCAANHMIRFSVDKLAKSYDYIVMDCEAGLEHISRQTTQDIDYLLAVTDPTMRGLNTAIRLKKLAGEMRTNIKGGVLLVINRLRNGMPDEIKDAVAKSELMLFATIPEDPNISDLDIKGKPLVNLPLDSSFRRAVQEILFRLKIK